MKNLSRLFILFFVSLLYTNSTLAIEYNYTTLIFLDYKDLRPIVQNALQESRSFKYPKDGERATGPLKKALKMLLSRPDKDDLVDKLSFELISDLKSMGVFEETVDELMREGEDEIFDESLNKKKRTTGLVLLNNLLLLIRPMTISNVQLATSVCKFADRDLKTPKEIQRQAVLTTMLKETSPTDLAKKIMLWYAKKKGRDVKTSKKGGCPFSKRV